MDPYDTFRDETVLVELKAIPTNYVGRLDGATDDALLLRDVSKSYFDADGRVQTEERPAVLLRKDEVAALELLPRDEDPSSGDSMMYGGGVAG